jgi:hypothetical protein
MEQAEIERLLLEREAARKRKEYARADEIRAALDAEGVIVEDTPYGATWRRRGWPAYAKLRPPPAFARGPLTFLGRDIAEIVSSIKFHDPRED